MLHLQEENRLYQNELHELRKQLSHPLTPDQLKPSITEQILEIEQHIKSNTDFMRKRGYKRV